jgi:hypothetical protein
VGNYVKEIIRYSDGSKLRNQHIEINLYVMNIKFICLTAEVRRITAGQTALLKWSNSVTFSLITRAFLYL